MAGYRWQIVTAVTWRIVAELCRRHLDLCGLSVLETHPGGGQYDCVSLFEVPKGQGNYSARAAGLVKHLCDFNQAGNLHSWTRGELRTHYWNDDRSGYVDAYLRADSPRAFLDDVEHRAGLPAWGDRPLPTTSPPVLCFRLIAAVLGRAILETNVISARMGYEDSSGMDGGMREAVRSIGLFRRQLAHALASKPTLDRDLVEADVASRFWGLGRGDTPGAPHRLWLCTSGRLEVTRTGEQLDLMQAYADGGRCLDRLTDRLWHLLETA